MTTTSGNGRIRRFEPQALGVLRIIVSPLFMQHGLQKLFEFPNAGHFPGPFHLASLEGVGGVFETFGGLAILLGFQTRIVSFILSGEMAVAYFLFHVPMAADRPWGLMPVVNDGDAAVLFCFVFLYLFVAGAGSFSLDAITAQHGARKRNPNPRP